MCDCCFIYIYDNDVDVNKRLYRIRIALNIFFLQTLLVFTLWRQFSQYRKSFNSFTTDQSYLTSVTRAFAYKLIW